MKTIKYLFASIAVIATGVSVFAGKAPTNKGFFTFTYFNRNWNTATFSPELKSTLTYTTENPITVCLDPFVTTLICYAMYTAFIPATDRVSHPEFSASFVGFGNGTYLQESFL